MAANRTTTPERPVTDMANEIVAADPHRAIERSRPEGAATRVYRRARTLFRGRAARVDARVDAKVSFLAGDEPRARSVPIGRLSFLAFVVMPTVAASIYFALFATDQYAAEMRFVIRQGSQDGGRAMMSNMGAAGGMLAMAGAGSPSGSAAEDAHIVTSYIHSRAMIDDISKVVNLREIFTRPEADLYARLPRGASSDELVVYWSGMVSTAIESTSGIVTVIVRTFRPADAVRIAEAIQALSETLVNDISMRARGDTLRRATEEVSRAQGLISEVLKDMERYRNEEGLIDPIQTATETGKLLTRVLTDQLLAEGQLFVMARSLGPDSPTVRTLQSSVDSLKRQTASLRGQLAGTKGETRNVAAALVRFEEIQVKQKVAESLYGIAETGLDRARRLAEARSVYLTPFVRPSLPEDASYPNRILFPLGIGAACLALWGIGAMIWASVDDHRIR